MEKTSEQIRHDMAIAYFNNLRVRELELVKAVQAVRDELVVCAKALDDTTEAVGKIVDENVTVKE